VNGAVELAQLVDHARARLGARLAGLDDAEYLWEPVPGCWSVRPDGAGGWRADVAADGTHFSREQPQPFTTIAWRLWHLGATPFRGWPPTDAASAADFTAKWFAMAPAGEIPAVGTAAEAAALVDDTWTRFAERCRAFTDEEVAGPLGPAGGRYAEASFFGLLLHVVDELIHHSAEVGVVRDLYAHRS